MLAKLCESVNRVNRHQGHNGSETDQKRTAARGARMSSTLTPEQLLSADWRQALPIFVQPANLCPSAWVVTTCRTSRASNLESSSPSRTSLVGRKFHATVCRTGQEMHGQHGQHWRLVGSLGSLCSTALEMTQVGCTQPPPSARLSPSPAQLPRMRLVSLLSVNSN